MLIHCEIFLCLNKLSIKNQFYLGLECIESGPESVMLAGGVEFGKVPDGEFGVGNRVGEGLVRYDGWHLRRERKNREFISE